MPNQATLYDVYAEENDSVFVMRAPHYAIAAALALSREAKQRMIDTNIKGEACELFAGRKGPYLGHFLSVRVVPAEGTLGPAV